MLKDSSYLLDFDTSPVYEILLCSENFNSDII